MLESKKEVLLSELVAQLCAERNFAFPQVQGFDELWQHFRALVNTREPAPISPFWLEKQNELLSGLLAEGGISSLDDAAVSPLNPRIRLWQGDITRLKVDGIVNAANSQMLGCWQPGHFCIDNAIHTFAGVQLRLECAQLMQAQGHEEPTGHAKITGGYNLPAKHVLHTVGPIYNPALPDIGKYKLMSSYLQCLDMAQENGLKSLAFCCISTGVFGYPKEAAAKVAVDTVQRWLKATQAQMDVVFNVFGDEDLQIYRRLLGF